MGAHYITALGQRRRSQWESLFGTSELPVKTAEPRWQALDPGRPEVLAYDLDAQALHPMQRERLAVHMALASGTRVDEARVLVETGLIPIAADGTELVE